MKSNVLLAYCTFPDQSTAVRICRQLVEERLIACANIFGSINSVYEWKSQLTESAEYAAILKTTAGKKSAMMERFRELHPYEIPALVFVAVEGGLPEFLSWIQNQST